MHPKNGFSLIELSIVLVILGLLVGGVLAGRALIQAAELRSQVRQLEQFYAASLQFKDQYFTLPGDLNTATQFWPTTVNGNNNGRLDAGTGARVFTGEAGFFWQHLALAGLIEGNYDGVTAIPLGVGLPLMKIDVKHGLHAAYYEVSAEMTNQVVVPFTPKAALYSVNAQRTALAGFGRGIERGIFSPEQMWRLDTKADDSVPQSGRLRARSSHGYNATNLCMEVNGGAADSYDIDGGISDSCGLMYIIRE